MQAVLVGNYLVHASQHQRSDDRASEDEGSGPVARYAPARAILIEVVHDISSRSTDLILKWCNAGSLTWRFRGVRFPWACPLGGDRQRYVRFCLGTKKRDRASLVILQSGSIRSSRST